MYLYIIALYSKRVDFKYFYKENSTYMYCFRSKLRALQKKKNKKLAVVSKIRIPTLTATVYLDVCIPARHVNKFWLIQKVFETVVVRSASTGLWTLNNADNHSFLYKTKHVKRREWKKSLIVSSCSQNNSKFNKLSVTILNLPNIPLKNLSDMYFTPGLWCSFALFLNEFYQFTKTLQL